MNQQRGLCLFGDLGHWNELQRDVVSADEYRVALKRLKNVVVPPAVGGTAGVRMMEAIG
jgi:hypothetical protein